MFFVQTEELPIFEQLQLEEALFRASTDNWCLINTKSPPALILGKSNSLNMLSMTPNIPCIRRYSGGGAVVVDHNTIFISFILSTTMSTEELMLWTYTLLAPAFAPHTLLLQENDFTISSKKVGGNAQAFTSSRAVHHISLLWSWDPHYMSFLAQPIKQPLYRQQRSHETFCQSLNTLFPSKELFIQNCVTAIHTSLPCQHQSLDAACQWLQYPHRKTVTCIL